MAAAILAMVVVVWFVNQGQQEIVSRENDAVP